MIRPWVAAIAASTAGLALGVAVTYAAMHREPLDFHHRQVEAEPRVKVIAVDPADDRGKTSRVHGVMGQRFFEYPVERNATEPSEHQLRFRFTAPAEILALDLSIDINDPRLTLVEFAVGLNTEEGWGWNGREFSRTADWLLMASWSGNTRSPGAIDESIELPRGVTVDPGDHVALNGWLGGSGTGGPLRVSPELVVIYRWLDQ